MQAFLIIFIALVFSTSVQAELMGMVPGRSARVQSHAVASIEVGANWYTNQLQWSTVRMNVKPSPHITLYADYAKLRVNNLPINASSQADFVGDGAGGGIMFSVPDFFPSYDIAFKSAFHATVIDNKPSSTAQAQTEMAMHQRQLSAEFVFSPIDPVFDNGLSWYGTLGYVSTDAQTRFNNLSLVESNAVRYVDKSGWAFGAGVFRPFAYGSFYAGIAWLAGDPLLGCGVRYSF